MRNERLQMIVEMGLAVALALVLNKFVVFKMPQGGSVNLEMLPILFIALRWGLWGGVVAGLAHGIMQLFFGADIYYPLQVVLDYPLAFAVIGLAGFFKTQMANKYSALYIILGTVIGVFARLFCHVLSGVIFFAEYAPAGQNVWIYSTVYNVTYIFPSLIATVVLLLLIKTPLAVLDRKKVAA